MRGSSEAMRGATRGSGRGRGRGFVGDYPVCKFYNGMDGSCIYGVECRFQHIDHNTILVELVEEEGEAI